MLTSQCFLVLQPFRNKFRSIRFSSWPYFQTLKCFLVCLREKKSQAPLRKHGKGNIASCYSRKNRMETLFPDCPTIGALNTLNSGVLCVVYSKPFCRHISLFLSHIAVFRGPGAGCLKLS